MNIFKKYVYYTYIKILIIYEPKKKLRRKVKGKENN